MCFHNAEQSRTGQSSRQTGRWRSWHHVSSPYLLLLLANRIILLLVEPLRAVFALFDNQNSTDGNIVYRNPPLIILGLQSDYKPIEWCDHIMTYSCVFQWWVIVDCCRAPVMWFTHSALERVLGCPIFNWREHCYLHFKWVIVVHLLRSGWMGCYIVATIVL
ncbi:hypothetical protein BS78_04G062900 [Paspalum vaginatum]|nr:hypothetical protein BS78_04G062900 [Paspalum vaginatum]